MRLAYRTLAYLLTVDKECRHSASTSASSTRFRVVIEGHFNGVLAIAHGFFAIDAEDFQSKEIVGVHRSTMIDPECPTAESASLGQQDTVVFVSFDLDLSLHVQRRIFDVDEGVFGHVNHTWVNGQFGSAVHQIRTSCDLGVEPLDGPIVDR